MVMNTQGKPCLAKFYYYKPMEKQQELIRSVFSVLCSRAENASNFVQADSILVRSESELAMLDLIQVFVETLDKCFKNECELDIVFNYTNCSNAITLVPKSVSGWRR